MMIWCVIFLVFCHVWLGDTNYVLTDEGEVLVPLSSKENDASTRYIHFSFHITDHHLEHQVIQFCEIQNIRYHFCHKLYAHVNKVQKIAQKEFIQKKLALPQLQVRADLVPSDLITGRHTIGNPDYIKHIQAVRDDFYIQSLKRGFQKEKRQKEAIEMQTREDIAVKVLHTYLQSNYPNHDLVRIAVIHSVAYTSDSTKSVRELRVILQEMQKHGLMDEAQTQLLLVLHYGHAFPSTLNQEFPDVIFLHVSPQTSFYELPSIRILTHLAKYFQSNQPAEDFVHMLYLSTFTAEYQHTYVTLEQWRSMLLYYLVEEHERCFHLLESTEFDMITAGNFRSNPERALEGNAFWTTSPYLSHFPLLAWDRDDIPDIATQYLFQATMTRVYTPHVSGANPWHDLYPRYCYAPTPDKQSPPSFEDFSYICQNPLIEDYVRLHNTSAMLDLNMFPPYSENFHRADSRREVSSFCTALEVSRVYD